MIIILFHFILLLNYLFEAKDILYTIVKNGGRER